MDHLGTGVKNNFKVEYFTFSVGKLLLKAKNILGIIQITNGFFTI